jgi:hypothetical protein
LFFQAGTCGVFNFTPRSRPFRFFLLILLASFILQRFLNLKLKINFRCFVFHSIFFVVYSTLSSLDFIFYYITYFFLEMTFFAASFLLIILFIAFFCFYFVQNDLRSVDFKRKLKPSPRPPLRHTLLVWHGLWLIVFNRVLV